MNIKKHIPNTITCGNLFCGCLAVVSALHGNLVQASYLVGLAAVLDFFDGFTARLLNVHSEIGKQLDSLADVVSFGVAPGIVVFSLLSNMAINPDFALPHYTIYIAFLIPVFSALRLAKFNIDTRQTDSFIGVPTPASSMMICSLPLIQQFQPKIGSFNTVETINNPYFLIGLTLILSYLMVAELPLFALKFKDFSWTNNQLRYSFLIISLIMLILFKFIAIPISLFLYVMLSIFNKSLKFKV
jgi:CDP-diacylglycerol--serine O-phosphatidyltransferase